MILNHSVMRLSSIVALLITLLSISAVSAEEPGYDAFERTWSRHDLPVQSGVSNRTWMWGPAAFTPAVVEPYNQTRIRYQPERRTRVVQYFDKARMEVTDPNADPESLWYVTNGLLVVEMMSGQLQVADDEFAPREPATINAAGDGDDPSGPTYADLAPLVSAPPAADDALLIQRLTAQGVVADEDEFAAYGVTAAHHVQVPGIDHQIASPFWDFMNASGSVWQDSAYTTDRLFEDPFYATGLPVTEAYWSSVLVGGEERDVLLQCFERRCLTYTPDNPEGWQVEAGNVGRHYYEWRYGHGPSEYEYSGAIPGPVEYLSAFTISADGFIYSVHPSSSLIQVHSIEGTFLDQWTLGDGEFHIADHDIEVGPDGNIYVLDAGSWNIWVYTPDGEALDPIPVEHTITGRAAAMAFGDDGVIYLLNQPVFRQEVPGTIDLINREGELLETWEGIEAIHYGRDLAVANGRLYVATDDGLALLSTGGQVIGQFPDIQGNHIAADADGNVYLSDQPTDDFPAALARITVVDRDGLFVTAWLPASIDGQLEVNIDEVRVFDGITYTYESRSNTFQMFAPRD